MSINMFGPHILIQQRQEDAPYADNSLSAASRNALNALARSLGFGYCTLLHLRAGGWSLAFDRYAAQYKLLRDADGHLVVLDTHDMSAAAEDLARRLSKGELLYVEKLDKPISIKSDGVASLMMLAALNGWTA